MKYARLKRVSESNRCTANGVHRLTVLKVESDGAVETVGGICQLHPLHIGRTVQITRHLKSGAILTLKIVD